MANDLMAVSNIHKTRTLVAFEKHSNITKWAGILIAVCPILAPYKLLGISLIWLLGGLFIICHLIQHASLPITASTKPVMIYTMLSMVLSVNGLLVLRNPNNLINAVIAMVVDLIIFSQLWYYSDIDITMKYANIFGYICCGYAVIQIIATISGNNVPLGQLPIFEVSTGWVPEVWGFRFNSLFSEPSYFAIYLLPLFIYHFRKNNWVKAIFFASFVLLSSSSLGIISVAVVVLLRFFTSDFSVKNKIKLLMIFFVVIILASILVRNIPMISSFLERSHDKIIAIFSSTSDGTFMENGRLGGYLNLFAELPIKEQIFGVGNAQLQNYFAEQGVYIYNYSNSFVLSLLNFGLLGFFVFVIFLGNLFFVSRKEKTLLFWFFLIITMGVDSLLFSYRYYWLVYFVLFSNKRMEKIS